MAVKPWVGAIKPPSEFDFDRLPHLATAPDSSLEMLWVHGYRCRDAFNNVAVRPTTGEVLWPAAATVVLLAASAAPAAPASDDEGARRGSTQRHVVAHPDDVRCLCLSPDGALCATGGQGRQPEVVVWAPDTLAVVARFEGPEFDQKRAIRAFCFSPDSALVCAVGDDNDHTLLLLHVSSGSVVDSACGGRERILAVHWAANG
jgi:WD40 repeat protein